MELPRQMQSQMAQFSTIPFGMALFAVDIPINYEHFNLSPQYAFIPNMQLPPSNQAETDLNQSLQYFRNFFSPINTALSLQKRNDNLEMMRFENSDEQPDDVYNRRKKKVSDLMTKQEDQLQIILDIRNQSQERFNAIIQFIKIFCIIKQQLPGYKNDYYSNKTFCAIKNSSVLQLHKATKIVQKMYENVMKHPLIKQDAEEQAKQLSDRMVEFLIIPRFLISKQKINRLSRDEELQRNFQFLVINQCLGHYNNEANKKMPQQKQMILVRELLSKKSGREKFKKICSINHGNKFLKFHGSVYYKLYSQSLNYLRFLESSLKKGKKFDTIKKDLEKIQPQTEETVGGNSSCNQSQSSNNIYSFKSFGDCLNNMEIEKDVDDLMGEKNEEGSVKEKSMQKGKIKKLMSLPIHEQQEVEQKVPEKRTFKAKKFMTMQNTTQNIILVPPPTRPNEI